VRNLRHYQTSILKSFIVFVADVPLNLLLKICKAESVDAMPDVAEESVESDGDPMVII